MKALDAGHLYELRQLDTDKTVQMRFVKRNSSTVQRDEEWAGLQTQEVMRVLIDRTKFLNDLIPCVESEQSLYHLRQALYLYEVRAYIRKTQDKNRKGEHDDTLSPKRHRQGEEFDVPFRSDIIEDYPIGEDGHVIVGDLHDRIE